MNKHNEAFKKVKRRTSKRLLGLASMPYEDRLRELKLPSLYYRRFRGDTRQIFKLIHGFFDDLVIANLPNIK